jgi:serine/threonine-protein kinase
MSEKSFEYDILLGKTIGDDYQIQQKLGVGGMGAVFKAKQQSNGQDVAVKVILPDKMADNTSVQRFLLEARTGLLLSHPNIVKTYKYSKTSDGLLFIVMEYVHGETLYSYLQNRGRLSLNVTIEFLKQLCSALDLAHKHKVLHRDLKPENILVTKTSTGEITKLTDFGVAKILSSGKTNNQTVLTKTGQVVGTPKYMSPEQLLGIAIKQTTDIYSLGLILYRMLTGVTPPEFEGKAGTMFKVTSDLPLISHKFSFIPSGFDSVFSRVLSRDPSLRYQTATDLFNAFQEVTAKYPDLVIPPLSVSPDYDNEAITITPTIVRTDQSYE